MKTIWKFPLELQRQQMLEIPAGAQILSAQLQPQGIVANQICLWALVNPEAHKDRWTVLILGTGHSVSDVELFDFKFVDTVQAGPFVWHIFIRLY